MPLSKQRMRERKRADHVKPKLEPWEVTDWANYKGPKGPLPNCPDGRYR